MSFNKRNILLVIPWLPYPLISGGHQALYNGIAAIKEDFNVLITYYVYGKEDLTAKEEFLKIFPNIKLFPMYAPAAKTWTLRRKIAYHLKRVVDFIVYGKVENVSRDANEQYAWWTGNYMPVAPKYGEYVYNLCKERKIDIVQIEMPWHLPFVLNIPEDIKIVFVHHELAFVRYKLELEKDPENIYAKAHYFETTVLERALLNKADIIITLSEADKQKLQENGVVKPVYSSFAIVNSQRKIIPYLSEERVLTFIGPDEHNPNIVGVMWFLDNCWQKLKAIDNSYKLHIIGKWTEENKNIFLEKYPDLEFFGFVDDLYDAIKGTVMIVPITIGSGIRMKILEAASNGVPFVSTIVGAEGIPVTDGKDCFLTDDPDIFVADILKLRDADLRKTFIINANKMIKKNYSLEALRRNRLEIYSNL